MIIRNSNMESGANACLTGPHTVYQTQGNKKKNNSHKFPLLVYLEKCAGMWPDRIPTGSDRESP